MQYKKFMRQPDSDLIAGIIVDKDTKIEFKNDNVKQTLENLTLHSVLKAEGEGFKSTYVVDVFLEEGDVLLFDESGRGYIKPAERFMTVEEAIEELECVLKCTEE